MDELEMGSEGMISVQTKYNDMYIQARHET